MANIKIIRNPLIIWLWTGSALLFVGTVLAFAAHLQRKKRIGNENQ
jgi:cytochrome c biogenesis factor